MAATCKSTGLGGICIAANKPRRGTMSSGARQPSSSALNKRSLSFSPQSRRSSPRQRLLVVNDASSSSPVSDLESSAADFCGADGNILDRSSKNPNSLGAKTTTLSMSSDLSSQGIVSGDKKYCIHTFGCQMNMADSERMAGILEELGYMNCTDPQESDLLILNTCSIRDKAEQKVYSALGPHAKRKRRDPNFRIVVAGCVAQQEGEALLRRIPEIDLVMGPQHANRIGLLLDKVDLGNQVCAVEELKIEEDIATPKRDSDLSAWVNIIYGCNEHCTYCVVPSTRGREQSRQPQAIKKDLEALGRSGYKEVTLLGQNIDAYGRDLPGMAVDGSGRRFWTFTDLLYFVAGVEGIERIRFATSHPRYFSKRLIKACYELPQLCEYFHIPFQSGDNDILKQMKRGYTVERYHSIINEIRRLMPDAAISTDIIVGFPGETEEQFQNTMKLVEDVEFDSCNTAAYSPRPMTPAAEWENQVADLIKSDRLNRLNRLVSECAWRRSQRYLGRTEEVLVEGINRKDHKQVWGRTRTNRMLFFDGDLDVLRKQFVHVEVTEARTYTLSGKMVK